MGSGETGNLPVKVGHNRGDRHVGDVGDVEDVGEVGDVGDVGDVGEFDGILWYLSINNSKCIDKQNCTLYKHVYLFLNFIGWICFFMYL